MKLDPETKLVVVETELFGQKKSRILKMALDTGATYTMIPWVVAEVLGYDPAISRRKVKLTTASGAERAPMITLQGIKVLGYGVDKVEVICHDLPPESTINGLLGLSYLKNFNLDLHFKDQKLQLKDP